MTDSRAVQQGDTFVAYPGEKLDGRQFIAQAIAQGANAVIWEAQHFVWSAAWQIPNLAVADLRHKAGWLADAVYGAPSEKLWMVGITGTNGKTSTCHWVAHALGEARKKCALIGTLGNGFPDALQASVNTTPDAIRVHSLLADYLRADAQAVAMEVSSHALAQGRVNGMRFDVALLTNLSRDHLDYHGDMESYAASKRKLFDWQQLKYAVLNLDDAFGAELAEELCGGTALTRCCEASGAGNGVGRQSAQRMLAKAVSHPLPQSAGCAGNVSRDADVEVIGYGMSDAALQVAERLGIRMVYGRVTEMSARGLCLDIHSSWGGAQLHCALVGRFNAANLLGVLAVLLVSDVGLDVAVQSLRKVQAVVGRMQRMGGAEQPAVIVDYAHTPDALEKVLLTLREVNNSTGGSTREGYTKGRQFAANLRLGEIDTAGGYPEAAPPPLRRLICVFGCGGDRDRGKRAMMGLVAGKFSDHCIVTSDNPRSEDPRHIIAEIVGGMITNNHEIIVNRAAAIERAVGLAQQRDTVLVAGKGHEDYQEINGVKHPFSDVQAVQQALQSWSALRQAQDIREAGE